MDARYASLKLGSRGVYYDTFDPGPGNYEYDLRFTTNKNIIRSKDEIDRCLWTYLNDRGGPQRDLFHMCLFKLKDRRYALKITHFPFDYNPIRDWDEHWTIVIFDSYDKLLEYLPAEVKHEIGIVAD